MDLSRWFSDQLQASRDVVLWATGQLSPDRVGQAPPPRRWAWKVEQVCCARERQPTWSSCRATHLLRRQTGCRIYG